MGKLDKARFRLYFRAGCWIYAPVNYRALSLAYNGNHRAFSVDVDRWGIPYASAFSYQLGFDTL